MIPIRDTVPSRNYPVVNSTLIGINIVVFLIQISQGAGFDRFIYFYGLVPARYSVPQIAAYFSISQQLLALLTFMFLHGGFLHLLGNMWSLYIFGDNVEDHLGPVRYIAFYLLCGLASGLSHLFASYYSNVPTIGASGAIAGVMGAYFILHPKAKILTLFPIFIIPWFVEIPAFVFLGLWFVIQFWHAAASGGTAGGIAWWAHIGGFVFGILFIKIIGLIPATGISRKVRRMTEKKKTHRLQVIRPAGAGADAHLYATIQISPYEALTGTHKLVNIPWGFHKRLVRVAVPPGIREGTKLRMRGMGKQMPNGQRGDLFLKIILKSA